MKSLIGKTTHYCNKNMLATWTSQHWLCMHGKLEMKRNKELEGAYGYIAGGEDRMLR